MPDIGTGLSVGMGLMGNNANKKAARRSEASAKAAAELAYQRSLPWDVQGAFGTAEFDEETRRLNMSLSDQWQGEYDYAMADAQNQRGYLNSMEADPMAAGQQFYEQQRALYAPQQQQDRLALESRLVAQGMFGSTGGAGQAQALRQAQGQVDLEAQYAGFDKAQSMIDTYRARETAALGRGETIGQMPQKYAETGRGIGTDMSTIAGQAGKMTSSAAQARAATTVSSNNAMMRQFGNIYDNNSNMFGSGQNAQAANRAMSGNQAGFDSWYDNLG